MLESIKASLRQKRPLSACCCFDDCSRFVILMSVCSLYVESSGMNAFTSPKSDSEPEETEILCTPPARPKCETKSVRPPVDLGSLSYTKDFKTNCPL